MTTLDPIDVGPTGIDPPEGHQIHGLPEIELEKAAEVRSSFIPISLVNEGDYYRGDYYRSHQVAIAVILW